MTRRSDRLLEIGVANRRLLDANKTLDNFDFTFNPKMNRSLVFDLATAAFIARHEDSLLIGPPGSGKSHLAQAIGQAAIQQGYRVLYRETHTLLDELAEASLDGTRKQHIESLATVPLLIIDDFGMRKLSLTAAEELLEIIMRRHENRSTMMTSNRPLEDWAKLIGDAPAATAILDRFLQHATIINITGTSYRLRHGGNGEAKTNTKGRQSTAGDQGLSPPEDTVTEPPVSSGSTSSPQAGAGASVEAAASGQSR